MVRISENILVDLPKFRAGLEKCESAKDRLRVATVFGGQNSNMGPDLAILDAIFTLKNLVLIGKFSDFAEFLARN